MERKEFLFKSCAFCGCAGLTMLTGQTVKAATDDGKEDWRIDFMQKRFAHLVDYMKSNIDDKARNKMIEEIGRFCAQQSRNDYAKFAGNIEEYLKDLESKWIEKTDYDKENKTIRMLGKKQEACACAFAGKTNISPDFCNCSKGWMKEAFSTIVGQPVDVSIDSSLLMGGDRCSFTIKLI
jgi:hypothetical protein